MPHDTLFWGRTPRRLGVLKAKTCPFLTMSWNHMWSQIWTDTYTDHYLQGSQTMLTFLGFQLDHKCWQLGQFPGCRFGVLESSRTNCEGILSPADLCECMKLQPYTLHYSTSAIPDEPGVSQTSKTLISLCRTKRLSPPTDISEIAPPPSVFRSLAVWTPRAASQSGLQKT